MLIADLFQETSLALTANKVRSGLTMLGIVIGIGSVIAMVAIGQGAQSSIQSNIENIGSNLLTVYPGAQRTPGQQVSSGMGSSNTLILADAEAIQNELSGVQAVAPEVSTRLQVVVKGSNTNTSIIGTVAEYLSVHKVQIAEGSFISSQQNKSSAKVAVLGPTTRDDLFGENVSAVGQKIRISGMEFTVIGVTVAKGGSGFGSADDQIFVPLTTAQRFFSGDDHLSSIGIEAVSKDDMTVLEEQISNLLLVRHNISNPDLADFRILNQEDIVATASTVTSTLTLLLGAIAGISLIVGGIGIMNMMLTTVTERTREIGLRKAIGAKRRDVSSQFLLEAVLLTFVGGVIGVIIGWLISLIVSYFFGFASTVTLSSVAIAFGVSAFIGILFGYYPAVRASKLNPIEALRYE